MIYNLCNLVDETNLDLFYKITIIEATQLPKFDHLTPKDEILNIINNIPPTFKAMVVPLLPEKISLSNADASRGANNSWSTRINFPMVPQDVALQELLDTYNNREVVAFLSRITHSHLYGTQAQPLRFSFNEMHSSTPSGLKGFQVSLSGTGYGAAKYFAGKDSDFEVTKKGLAFTLAGSL